jgi:hypothetical protein
VLPLPVALCIQKRVMVSYPKWNLRNGILNFITHAIIYSHLRDSSLPFFNTVPLDVINILISGLVAAKGFKTYCFQAVKSNKSLMSFTSVTD